MRHKSKHISAAGTQFNPFFGLTLVLLELFAGLLITHELLMLKQTIMTQQAQASSLRKVSMGL